MINNDPPDRRLLLDEDSLAELADGWAWSTVGEVFSEIKNGTTATQNKESRGIPVSRIETIQNARFDLARVGYIEDAPPDLVAIYRYGIGDIAFSHINSLEHVGKTAVYVGQPPVFLHGMNLLRLRANKQCVDSGFLHTAMQTKFFREQVRERVGRAVNQVSINQKRLSEVPLPVAPLAEQPRIVAKLRELFEHINSARNHLSRVPAVLKRFRQAVLAAACSGRLTEDWRDKRDLSSASVLLKSVLKEREQRWFANQDASKGSRKPYPAPFKPPSSQLPEIPDSWVWVTLDQLIVGGPQNGLYKPRSEYGKGLPIIRIEDFQDTLVRKRDALSRLTVTKEETKVYGVAPDDLIINRVNSPSHIGKCLVVGQEMCPAVFESNMMRMKVATGIQPMWVAAYLRSGDGKTRLTENAKWAVNQVSINQTDVRSTPVPLPPEEEQQQIIVQVDCLFALADTIERRVAAATSRHERLTQSILAKAFRGELVPTEAELARREGREYEPASVLLERIKKGQESEIKGKVKTTRTRKSKMATTRG